MVLPISGAEVENSPPPYDLDNLEQYGESDPYTLFAPALTRALSTNKSYYYTQLKDFSLEWTSGSAEELNTATYSSVSNVSITLDSLGYGNVYTWNLGKYGTITPRLNAPVRGYFQGSVPTDFQYFISATVDIPYAQNTVCELSGELLSWLRLQYEHYPNTTGVLTYENLYFYPDQYAIFVDDEVVSPWFTLSSNQTLLEGFQFSIPESGISRIGLVFRFSNAVSSKISGLRSATTSTCLMHFDAYLMDGLYLNLIETPPYVPILTDIANLLGVLPQNTYNYFFQGVDPDSGSDFQSSVDQKQDEVDQIEDELNQLEKPDPEVIVPDIDTIIDSEDEYHVQYIDLLSGILSNSMITNILLLLMSMCFVSYVLFGKKG